MFQTQKIQNFSDNFNLSHPKMEFLDPSKIFLAVEKVAERNKTVE